MSYFLSIIGGHYGDEAKGKITDLLAPNFDAVVRGSGGNNAGHTIIFGENKVVLNLLPAGVLHKGPINVLGNEMVIDVLALVAEIEKLRPFNLNPKLVISSKATIVADWHRVFDGADESSKVKIGTTKRGIGPAAESKYNRRWALQVKDLFIPNLEEKMFRILSEQRLRLIQHHPRFHKDFIKMTMYDILYSDRKPFDNALKKYVKEEANKLRAAGKEIARFVVDDVGLEMLKYSKILGEGAQGHMLDPTFGVLPFTTSTLTTIHGITRGMGLELPNKEVMGVFKAYETRVGEGTFPTEMPEALGLKVQKKGGEFGATTGRPRRCGWFNLVEAKYAQRVNGLTWIAITKMDVLDGMKEIKVGIESVKGKIVYKSFKGWSSTLKCRKFEDLPAEAKEYLKWLESQIASLAVVSVGPDRESTIYMPKFLAHLKENGVNL